MATVEIDVELLRAFFLPGLKAQIVSCSWLSDQFHDAIALELSGPDVPDCNAARIVMTQKFDETRPCVILTATIKPVD